MMKQREAKFKAYDIIKNKVICEGFHVVGEVTMFNMLEQYCHENMEGETGLEKLHGFEIVQFTGAIDKHGKDIYEGDKVKHKYRRIWQTNEHVSTVVWDEGFFCYYLFDGQNYHRMREDIIYEIIGNIYEK